MAMANLRRGGYIIIGVGRVGNSLERTGVDASLLTSYDADRVLGAIAKYAEPAVDAAVGIVEYDTKSSSLSQLVNLSERR
jgi:predicted HTH transcriptional regulator